ncbi:RNA 3'-terminal phosphate cyclase [Halanaeroarchaeum sp. HSR-CO]|uniref:RNA 3'-terminal phosphate cyclase n=1 Tax=Halanaeroarchaeum sp. HSR-CO TaxID=2866382 RepID=UPI00217CC651|nr:RNA 3'-terminal phosphate cyclase [Halanaeroarchaeum sp. HSR-CO]UWG47667.1 RNA 3'-terminal phosphate cyclase [Halanaeroarchaeum sp. HSR-CO]
MRTVDGRTGGGQLVRTAVAMSAVTGDPILMENVRGARDQPGLRAQHVAAVETVASLADATTAGVEIGSEEFRFDPGGVTGGEVEQSIGTAGSVTLVFDAVLPLATRLDETATVTVAGGTDVKWAPPFDYFRSVKLPTVDSLGIGATVTLHRRGFYPAGGGEATLAVEPASMTPLEFDDRSDLESIVVHSVASTTLESASVADRQADAAVESLDALTAVPITTDISYVEAADKGSAIVIASRFESSIGGFTALGEPGKPSEAVAKTATNRFQTFLSTDAAVDAHLADQLVPLLALAGGRIRIPRVTNHVETHLSLVRAFGFPVRIERLDGGEARLVAEVPGDQGTMP